jgi:benzoate-CoA ligase
MSGNTSNAVHSVPQPLGDCAEMGERFNFAQHIFTINAGRAEKRAVRCDYGQLTYGALAENARRLAAGLSAAGVRREDRMMVFMQDVCHWPVSFLGAMYGGVVPVAINTLLTAPDLAYMLANSRARAVAVSGALLPTLREALSMCAHDVSLVLVSHPETIPFSGAGDGEALMNALRQEGVTTVVDMATWLSQQTPLAEAANTSPDSPGFWLYSSGSTGRPKGTVHSHGNPYWTAEYYGKGVLKIGEDDVCFSAAKLFFAYGLGNALTFPFSVGASVVLMAERPTPDAVFKRWIEQRPTVFFGAPTGFAGMLASPNLPKRSEIALRLVSSAGEALPADLGERFTAQYGVEIVDGIGSTEMLHIYLSNRPGDVRYGTTGFPVPGYTLSLRGDDGREVPDGEVGDLYISGQSTAMYYWENVAKSRDTFQGAWLKSGDKYVRNADGTYTYAGRSDDMLKVSGVYVSPFEVEATLVQHTAILEAAVIGVPDANGLTRVKAYVVLKDGATATSEELQAFVKERLAPYKYPRQIEFLDELPKTATGKIQRFRLRAANA